MTRALAWTGLAISLALIGFAVWIHLHLDPIMRVLPALIFGGTGMLIGLLSVQGLLATSMPPHRWTRPAPEWLRGPGGVVLGLALIAAGAHGLLQGSVRVPNVVFAREVSAADAPVAYWTLVVTDLVGGVALLVSGARMSMRRRHP